MDQQKIIQLLERLGQALSSSDFRTVAACWEVPALVLSDEGVIAVAETSEVENFFAQATESYHAQGIMSTKPVLEDVDPLSEKLASINVLWRSFDVSGHEQASERSHYIVRLGDDGEFHIRVALTRTT